MASPQMALPPGATLVDDGTMPLPPGAELVDEKPKLTPKPKEKQGFFSAIGETLNPVNIGKGMLKPYADLYHEGRQVLGMEPTPAAQPMSEIPKQIAYGTPVIGQSIRDVAEEGDYGAAAGHLGGNIVLLLALKKIGTAAAAGDTAEAARVAGTIKPGPSGGLPDIPPAVRAALGLKWQGKLALKFYDLLKKNGKPPDPDVYQRQMDPNKRLPLPRPSPKGEPEPDIYQRQMGPQKRLPLPTPKKPRLARAAEMKKSAEEIEAKGTEPKKVFGKEETPDPGDRYDRYGKEADPVRRRLNFVKDTDVAKRLIRDGITKEQWEALSRDEQSKLIQSTEPTGGTKKYSKLGPAKGGYGRDPEDVVDSIAKRIQELASGGASAGY